MKRLFKYYYSNKLPVFKKILDILFYSNFLGLKYTIRRLVWKGDAGTKWNSYVKSSDGSYPEQRLEVYQHLERSQLINKKILKVVEFGVGNGYTLQSMANKFVNTSFIGYDIDIKTISFNSSHYSEINCEFKLLQEDWIDHLDNYVEDNLLILFHSTLAYLFPEEVLKLSKKLMAYKNLTILITDTWKVEKQSINRGNLAFNHNIQKIFANYSLEFKHITKSNKKPGYKYLSFILKSR